MNPRAAQSSRRLSNNGLSRLSYNPRAYGGGRTVSLKRKRRAALQYLDAARQIVARIATKQFANILEAADICSGSIAAGGWVHLFGTGHSRMAVEEMFPRIGSLVGFHPIAELSLTSFHNVVGANGLRQALFLEKVEGLGEVILSSY